MKNIILVALGLFTGISSFAQYREVEEGNNKKEETRGFQKDHLFTGGGVQLGLSNYNFVVGASPVIGYSFNKYFDAGIGLNFTYATAREVYDNGYEVIASGNKIRQTDIAPVAFARVYPLKFLFIQLLAEHNFISQKYIWNSGQPTEKIKYDVTSLLPGVGYCGGREDVGDVFYYFSLSIDVLKNKNSPYVQRVYGSNNVNLLPILRAGVQIPLFQGRR